MPMIARMRLWFTATRDALMPEGHQDAAFLYAAIGDEIPDEMAERFGLVDGLIPGAPDEAAIEAARREEEEARARAEADAHAIREAEAEAAEKAQADALAKVEADAAAKAEADAAAKAEADAAEAVAKAEADATAKPVRKPRPKAKG